MQAVGEGGRGGRGCSLPVLASFQVLTCSTCNLYIPRFVLNSHITIQHHHHYTLTSHRSPLATTHKTPNRNDSYVFDTLDSTKINSIFRTPPRGQRRKIVLDRKEPKYGFKLEVFGCALLSNALSSVLVPRPIPDTLNMGRWSRRLCSQ